MSPVFCKDHNTQYKYYYNMYLYHQSSDRKNVKSQLLIHLFSASPFMLLLLIAISRISLYLVIHSVGAPSFTASANLFINLLYLMSAIWATLSSIFLISNRLQFLLEKNARLDPLTSILYRRAMRECFKREIALAKRYGSSLSFIICDIDYLKKINDTYGHLTGDAVLVQTVNLFEKCLRCTDLLARYGGEEFAFILPHTDSSSAKIITERLRKVIKITPLKYENNSVSITCSFGLTCFDQESDTYEALIKRADSALYEAKKKW